MNGCNAFPNLQGGGGGLHVYWGLSIVKQGGICIPVMYNEAYGNSAPFSPLSKLNCIKLTVLEMHRKFKMSFHSDPPTLFCSPPHLNYVFSNGRF